MRQAFYVCPTKCFYQMELQYDVDSLSSVLICMGYLDISFNLISVPWHTFFFFLNSWKLEIEQAYELAQQGKNMHCLIFVCVGKTQKPEYCFLMQETFLMSVQFF